MLIEPVMLVAVADILIDAASVLGGDATLQILYKKLVEVGILLSIAGMIFSSVLEIYQHVSFFFFFFSIL